MKKRLIAVLLAVTVVALTLPVTVLAAPSASFAVRLAADAGESEKAVAALLQDYLEAVTGARPKLVSAGDDSADQTVELVLRQGDKSARKGAYVLRAGFDKDHKSVSDGSRVFYIDASDARGLWSGAYGFLRRLCGVVIYSADVKTVPFDSDLRLPATYWYDYTPLLEYADTDWISPHSTEFALANGLNGSYSPLDAVHGGKVKYIWFCHSLASGIVPRDVFFETHPEYYALTERSGKRESTQLCLSNPEVVEQAKKDVLENIEKNYDPDAALNIVSVTQSDNQDYCVCDNCNAIAQKYGGQSGLMIWFVNQIAEAVEAEYPDVVVDTFAYQYTRQAPQNIKPRDNVCVRLCSIECCFAHALEDPDCDRNAAFMKDLRDWAALSNRLYVWDYVTNFIQTIGIFPNFGVLRRNIATFRENNVVGLYEEGAYYADACNAEFADLRAYLLSRNMQEELTEEEERVERDAFLDAYYGEGGVEVGKFLDYITEHAGAEDGHLSIYYSMTSTLHDVTAEDAKRMDGLWDQAIANAREAGNEQAVERIERSRLSWRYYEACVAKGEFSSILTEVPRFDKINSLIGDLDKFGIVRYNEGSLMKDVNPVPYFSPDTWGAKHGTLYPIAMAVAAAVLLLVFIAAIIAAAKKHPVCALLMIFLGAVCLVFGTWSSVMFIRWDQLLIYAIVDAIMLLSVAIFGFIGSWAGNGCRMPRGKRLAAAIIFNLFFAAAPYEVGVLLINTIILKSQQPTYAITLSAFVQMAVLAANVVLIISGLLKSKKKTKDETEDVS